MQREFLSTYLIGQSVAEVGFRDSVNVNGVARKLFGRRGGGLHMNIFFLHKHQFFSF